LVRSNFSLATAAFLCIYIFEK
jgi:hypothetical protein